MSRSVSPPYIDDFLEQLIGHMPGETVNVEVTFPVPYPNNPDLAGKDALFVTEINYTTEYADPEFTDDFVKENLYGTYGLSTVAEVREYIENSIREESITQYIKAVFLKTARSIFPTRSTISARIQCCNSLHRLRVTVSEDPRRLR